MLEREEVASRPKQLGATVRTLQLHGRIRAQGMAAQRVVVDEGSHEVYVDGRPSADT